MHLRLLAMKSRKCPGRSTIWPGNAVSIAAAAIEEAFPDTVVDRPLRFRDFIANSRKCKLYDFDGGRWLTYAEARAETAAQAATV